MVISHQHHPLPPSREPDGPLRSLSCRTSSSTKLVPALDPLLDPLLVVFEVIIPREVGSIDHNALEMGNRREPPRHTARSVLPSRWYSFPPLWVHQDATIPCMPGILANKAILRMPVRTKESIAQAIRDVKGRVPEVIGLGWHRCPGVAELHSIQIQRD